MLEITDLIVKVDGHTVLKDFSLKVLPGEVHAIMGPNGAGKSTLAKVLGGDPTYDIEGGSISFCGKDLLELDPEERAHLGLFMSFQYPVEIRGLSNIDFLRYAFQEKTGEEIVQKDFLDKIRPILQEMQLSEEFLYRDVNDGFSGGEKKRNEILQMLVLNPLCAILDETDSGLDIDALRKVSEGINQFRSPEKSIILITHYQRLLDYVKPDFVHVMQDGCIRESGDWSMALHIEEKGYSTC